MEGTNVETNTFGGLLSITSSWGTIVVNGKFHYMICNTKSLILRDGIDGLKMLSISFYSIPCCLQRVTRNSSWNRQLLFRFLQAFLQGCLIPLNDHLELDCGRSSEFFFAAVISGSNRVVFPDTLIQLSHTGRSSPAAARLPSWCVVLETISRLR